MDCSNIVGYLIHIFIDVFVTPVGKESLLTPRKKLISIYSQSQINLDIWKQKYSFNRATVEPLYPMDVIIELYSYDHYTNRYSYKSDDNFRIIYIFPRDRNTYPKYLQVFLRTTLTPTDFDVCITIGIVTHIKSAKTWIPIMSISNQVHKDNIIVNYNFDEITYVKPVVLGLYTLIFMQMLKITTIFMCEFPTEFSRDVRYNLSEYREKPPPEPYIVISFYMMVFIWLSAWVQSKQPTKGINNISLLSDSIFGEINNQLNKFHTRPVSITPASNDIKEVIKVTPTDNSQIGSKSSNESETIQKEIINLLLSTMVSTWMDGITPPSKEVTDQIITQINQKGITNNYYLTPDILKYLSPSTNNTDKPIVLSMLNNLNKLNNKYKKLKGRYWSQISIPYSVGYANIESLATNLKIPPFFWLSLKQLFNIPPAPAPTPTPTHSLGDHEQPNRSFTKCLRDTVGCPISGGSGTRRNQRKMKPVMRCVGRTCRHRRRRTVYKIVKNRRRNRRTCRYRECAGLNVMN